jgi:hypothetical protein
MTMGQQEPPENQRHPERLLTIGGYILDLDSFVALVLVDKETGNEIALDLNLIEEQEAQSDGKKVEQAYKAEVELHLTVCHRVPGLMRSEGEKAKTFKVLLHLKPTQGVGRALEGKLTLLGLHEKGQARNHDLHLRTFEVILPPQEIATPLAAPDR